MKRILIGRFCRGTRFFQNLSKAYAFGSGETDILYV